MVLQKGKTLSYTTILVEGPIETRGAFDNLSLACHIIHFNVFPMELLRHNRLWNALQTAKAVLITAVNQYTNQEICMSLCIFVIIYCIRSETDF